MIVARPYWSPWRLVLPCWLAVASMGVQTAAGAGAAGAADAAGLDEPPAGTGWCSSSRQLCCFWERKLLQQLRHPHNVSDVLIGPSVFGEGHTIRTLDVGGEGERGEAQARQKPTVVLIHGYANGLGVWFKCIDPLVDAGFRVLAIDIPGFALSSRPEFPVSNDGSAAEGKMVEALDDWRKRMQLGGVVLCGHSFGAYIAASYALRYPRNVQQLLLVDPWGLPVRDPSALKEAPLSRRLLLSSVALLSQIVEPVTLLQLSGSYSMFARSREHVVRNLDAQARDAMMRCLHHFVIYIHYICA